jgi:hypothetical protein
MCNAEGRGDRFLSCRCWRSVVEMVGLALCARAPVFECSLAATLRESENSDRVADVGGGLPGW